MGVIEGRTWLEKLSEGACYELLREQEWGRLAVSIESHPEIFPVNYAVDDRAIVFRVDAGTKLSALHRSGEVAFEIDHADSASHTGWSVLVVGSVSEITGVEEMRHARTLELKPWAVGPKVHWMRIDSRTVTGRRIVPTGVRPNQPVE